MLRRIFISFLSLFILIVVTACSSSGSTNEKTNSTKTQTLEIKATNFKFDKSEYIIKKGVPIKITLTNVKGYHGIQIEGMKVSLQAGKSQVITPQVPGTYKIRCKINCGSGHKDMFSTLVVK